MSKKLIKYKARPFESNPTILPSKKDGTSATDVSANIYASMLLSKNWQDLTYKQRNLYLICKLQYFSEKKTKDKLLTFQEKMSDKKDKIDISSRFTMNKSKWCDFYHLYSNSTSRYFYQDMNVLQEKGFIDLLQSGKTDMSKNIYSLSNRWSKD